MRRLSFLPIVLFTVNAFAQITINQNHMPSSGDEIEYSTAIATSTVDVITTGADKSWDFTKLVAITDGVEEYKRSLSTPYVLNFGFSALGKKLQDTLGFSDFQLKNIYNFYKVSSSSFTDVGIGFQFSSLPLPQAGKHSDPDEIYVFPLEYENRDSTTFAVTVPIKLGFVTVGSFTRTGNRVTTVDGWGKISTPFVTDEDCIRLRSVLTERDSISVTTPSFGFGNDVKIIEYKWLSTSEKIPVLTITGNEIAGNFVPTSIIFRNEWSAVKPIVVDFDADMTTANTGTVISLTNKSTGDNLTYDWGMTPSSGFIFVNGTDKSSEHPKIVFQNTGVYSVALTATSGANSESMGKIDYITISNDNSSVIDLQDSRFEVYPNPASDVVTIRHEIPNTEFSVHMFDATGRQVKSVTATNILNLDITELHNGLYSLEIRSKSQTVVHKLFVD